MLFFARRSPATPWLAPRLALVLLGTAAALAAFALAMPADAGLASGLKPAAAPHARRAARVLIISEDGLRGDALSQHHLPWHESLYRHGAFTWKARTIRTASTLPSHAAMLSGFDVDMHGLTWNNWKPDRGYIRVPSIFDEAGQHGMKSAMFVGKFKLRHIARPGTVEVFERPGYYCKKVAAEAAEYLVREQPPLAFVHFSNPDDAGHLSGWVSDDYDHAVVEDDRCLGVILGALQKAELEDDTLIIISADHGGHNRTHSGALSVDREIPWIAHGPGVRSNYHIRRAISTVDTAATALEALGLPVPEEADGRPITEIYSE